MDLSADYEMDDEFLPIEMSNMMHRMFQKIPFESD